MKKTLSLALTVAMAAMAAMFAIGCSSPSAPAEPMPSDTVKSALEALKAQDAATLQKCFGVETSENDVAEMTTSISGVDVSSFSEEQQAEIKKLAETVLDYDYTLANEQVNGDRATVDVTITTRDLGTAFNETVNDFIGEVLSTALDGNVDTEAMAMQFLQAFSQKLAMYNSKDYTSTTTVSLNKTENGWVLDQPTPNNIDCLLGGMYSAINDLSTMFQSFGGSLDQAA